MKRPARPMRAKLAAFVEIVVATAVAAVIVHYLVGVGIVPAEYEVPINAVIVVIGGYLIIRTVNQVLDRALAPTIGKTRTRGVKNLSELTLGIVVLVFVFTLFGVNLTAALLGAGFLAIVLGLAAQQVLGNVFAGLTLLVSKPFEIGDRVKLATPSYGLTGSSYDHENEVAGFVGTIQDVGIFFTNVLLENGVPSTFPNSIIIGSLIVNYSRVKLRSVRVRFDLDRKIDFDAFKSRFLGSLAKIEELDPEKTTVEIAVLEDSTYQVLVTAWAQVTIEEPTKTKLIREGMKVLDDLRPKSPTKASS